MPRVSKKKFGVEPGSVEAKGMEMTKEEKVKYHWNQKKFYAEYYEMERWADRGFTEHSGE